MRRLSTFFLVFSLILAGMPITAAAESSDTSSGISDASKDQIRQLVQLLLAKNPEADAQQIEGLEKSILDGIPSSERQQVEQLARTISISPDPASLLKTLTAASYLAGLAFSIAAIMKFKQHKDNPTQIPIGAPIALVFIAAALLFLPSVLGTPGRTKLGPSTTK